MLYKVPAFSEYLSVLLSMIWMCMAGHAVLWKPTNPFSFEELCILLLFQGLYSVYMGEINSYSWGRTSQLKIWCCILAPVIFQPCLTTVFLRLTHILRGDFRFLLFAINDVGASLSSLPPLSGSELLTSCFMFWESHFYSRLIFASLVAPWPSSEELIAGRKERFWCVTVREIKLLFQLCW